LAREFEEIIAIPQTGQGIGGGGQCEGASTAIIQIVVE